MIRDDQKWMGGVDVHDQLRLQRYSLQLAIKFTKYYKTIALGMIDMAITNAYICQREARKAEGKPAADHDKFLLGLHAQLIAMTDADFEDTVNVLTWSSNTNAKAVSNDGSLAHTR
ncbi:hypothetical protein PF005_g7092 [Phytophthora fragariae]|uniref:PiggyBac transposable element-derived protein domain-containing protein n=1 Tax=Phytophthora fragariae TaxID=53985 RepID=A0A6A3YNC7_9STRA|nr:hypothetical protein PF011_g6727 [Phytophthora fragariae]KAE9221462.1 hypothetical protein PF005_g7092 [Phytophthora fragariae]